MRNRGAVGAVRGNRVIGVDQRDQARLERYGLAGQPVGIARSVVVLVMVPDDAADRRAVVQPGCRDDALAQHAVFLHVGPVFAQQAARMMQDAIGHAQLADVVQARAQFQAAYRHAIQPVCPAQFPGQRRDASAVYGSAGVACAQRGSQGAAGARIGFGARQ
ncbi:Uncharacterised protein [Bordetella pertussis]|nr:Uncharacterised protein [Bordetella pertussis]